MSLSFDRLLELFFLISVISVALGGDDCKPIDAMTVKAAAHCSDAIYELSGEDMTEGKMVPQSYGFKIIKRIDLDVGQFKLDAQKRMSFTGEPLKMVIAERGNDIMICFMGTDSAEQLLKEFGSGTEKPINVTIAGKEVKVMRYFWDAFQAFDEDLTAAMNEVIKKSKKARYIITGHSLGGAIAQLFALNATGDTFKGRIWEDPESSLITFGSPRIGDEDFADLHDEKIPPSRKLRIVNNEDMIAHVPPKGMKMLKKVKDKFSYFSVLFDSIPTDEYRHASREIWIEKQGWIGAKTKWRVCPLGDPEECSNKLLSAKYDIIDHLMSKYLKAVDKLLTYPGFKQKFEKDQCKAAKDES